MTDSWTGPSNYSGGNQPARSHNVLQEHNSRYGKPRNQGLVASQSKDQAVKLALHLHARGIGSEHLQTTHPNILRHHAMMAGVTNPTDEVWTMTHHLLQRQETGGEDLA